jgi:predicted  nucleic acid-binding Zn-ribbon protein
MDVTVSHGTSSSGDPNLTLLDYHRLQTPPMRGMTPEEAAAYKRLKSRIFTRVSRGKEGVMDGIESFHCPLCKCKTTVDFTSHLVEKDATIASLTAMLETSVTLDVWKMTVQEFERTIASLTDDVDRLTGYSERLNGLRERLEDRNAALATERDDYKAHFEVCDANRQQVVIERDALKARSVAVIKGRDHDNVILRDALAVVTAERDRLQGELDAANRHVEIVRELRDVLHAERDALNTEIARLEYCLRNSVGDACNLDTECRKAARSVLGDVVDGTEYGVPTLLDVVALVVALARNVTVERDEALKQGLSLTLLVDELREEILQERTEFNELNSTSEERIAELREALALAQNALAQAH